MTDLPSERPPDRQLTGWKEIASYFGKAVRTVQRWEAELSLPVRRIQTRRGDTVYALVGELEAWRRGLDVARLASGWDRDEASLGWESADGADLGGMSRPPGLPGGNGGSAVLPVPRRVPTRRWQPYAIAAGSVALLAVAALVAVRLLAPGRPDQPAEVRTDFDTFSAHDASGRFLWSHRFGAELLPVRSLRQLNYPGHRPRALIRDLDRDGNREVLVLERAADYSVPDALICLDARGRRRFELSAPKPWVQFGNDRYGPPWIGHNVFVTGEPGRSTIWVAWVHLASGNFPCVLQRVSMTGRVESEFWSAGYVEMVGEAVLRGRRVVLVGASNNDHRGASLAMFERDSVRGSAPAETEGKTCRGCPPGGPVAFLVFPRLELARLAEGIPTVVGFHGQEDGLLRVTVAHAGGLQDEPLVGFVFYDLDADFRPLRAEISADYVSAHRRLEAAARVGHAFGDVDRAEAWPVLAWNGGRAFAPVTGATDK